MSSCHGSAFGRGRARSSLCLPAKNTEPAAWEDLLHPETSHSVAEEPGLGSPCLLALPSGLSFPTCTMGSHTSEMMLTGLTLTVMSLPSSCTFHSSLGPRSCPRGGLFAGLVFHAFCCHLLLSVDGRVGLRVLRKL